MMVYRDSVLDLVAVAVGHAGQLAMDKLVNDPQYASEHFCLTPAKRLVDAPKEEQESWMQIFENTTLAMVMADVGEPGILDQVCEQAAFLRQQREVDRIVCVTLDRYAGQLDRVYECFDQVYLVEAPELLHLPMVPFRNLRSENRFICIDIGDLLAVLQDARTIHVTQRIYETVWQAIEGAAELAAYLEDKQRKHRCCYKNGIFSGSFGSEICLDEIEDIVYTLYEDTPPDANFMIDTVINPREEDPTTTLLLFSCLA